MRFWSAYRLNERQPTDIIEGLIVVMERGGTEQPSGGARSRKRMWKKIEEIPHDSATGRQLSLMGDLSRGVISPADFAESWLNYRRNSLADGERIRESLSRRLDQVFYALDDYPIDPAFREAGDVTDAELLSVVVKALDQIRHDEEPRTGHA